MSIVVHSVYDRFEVEKVHKINTFPSEWQKKNPKSILITLINGICNSFLRKKMKSPINSDLK